MAATKEKRIPTEAELLKMPESDYMNDAQRAFFRDRLQQIERDILANADETSLILKKLLRIFFRRA